MNNMWSFVDAIRQNLDEVAGLATDGATKNTGKEEQQVEQTHHHQREQDEENEEQQRDSDTPNEMQIFSLATTQNAAAVEISNEENNKIISSSSSPSQDGKLFFEHEKGNPVPYQPHSIPSSPITSGTDNTNKTPQDEENNTKKQNFQEPHDPENDDQQHFVRPEQTANATSSEEKTNENNSNNNNKQLLDELQALKAQNMRLAQAMGESVSQNTIFSEDIAKLKSQLQQSEQQNSSFHSQISNLKKTLHQLETSAASSSASSNNSGLMIEQLKQEGMNISRELGLERTKVKDLNKEKKILESQVSALEEAVSSLQTKLDAAIAETEHLKAVNSQNKNEISSLRSLLDQKEKDESLHFELAQQEGQRKIDAENKEKSLLENRLRDQLKEYEDLGEKYVELQQQRDVLAMQSRAALLASEERISQLERQVGGLSLRADLAEARALESSSGISDALSEWGARVRRSEQLLDDAGSKYSALNRLYEKSGDEVARLTRENEKLRNGENSHEQQLASLGDEVKRYRAEADEVRRKKELAEERGEEIELVLKRLQKEHAAEMNRLQGEMLELVKTNSASQQHSENHPATTVNGVVNDNGKNNRKSHQQNPYLGDADLTMETKNYNFGVNNNNNSSNYSNVNGRIEKQVARLSAELSEERIGVVKLRREYEKLSQEHDMLLQMYGQMLEGKQQQQ